MSDQARPGTGNAPGIGRSPAARAAAAFVVATCSLLAFFKLNDFDLFWHLKTGEVILETGRLVHVNLFSHTFPERPWLNPEWLFQVVLAALHRAGGWNAIWALKFALVVAVGLLLHGILARRGAPPWTAAALAALALCVVMSRLSERPHLFSLAFFLATLALLERARAGKRGALLVLPPLFAVWSNIHPEVIIGLLAVTVEMLGERFLDRRSGDAASWSAPRSAALVLACAAATLLNPETYRVLLFPFLHFNIGPTIQVAEYAASTPDKLPQFWLFLALVLGALWTTGFLRDRRELLLLIILGGGAAAYQRATPYFVFAGAAAVASRIATLTQEGRHRRLLRASAPAFLAGAAFSFAWGLGPGVLRAYAWGWGLSEEFMPKAAADRLASGRYPGELFNAYGVGGYLIHRLYPTLRVFQDGRLQAYPQDFVAKLHAQGPEPRPALLKEHGVNTALVHHVDPGVFPEAEWALTFWDESWRILVRRTPGTAAFLGEAEYRLFVPGAAPPSPQMGIERLRLLEREMERNQAERSEPSDWTDRQLSVVHALTGNYAGARDAIARALKRAPDDGTLLANLGLTLARLGETGEARAYLERAIAINPALSVARSKLEELRAGQPGRPGPP